MNNSIDIPPLDPTKREPIRVSVIVPTFHEVLSIPLLISRLGAVRDASGLDLEVLLMDDDSADGSVELMDSLALPWARMIVRKADRGLSFAVVDGMRLGSGSVLVVMDADLSHPPEKIPEMVATVMQDAELAVGSRFVDGGSTADDWGVLRWLNSRIATLLAFPLTTISDPMSGFFAMRKSTFLSARDLSPVGYKIMLELIVKTRSRRIVEVPIHFDNRRFGESKLSFKEQLRYLKHLRRLYTYKYGTWSHLIQFLVVGASGLVVNLAALTALIGVGVGEKIAVALAIMISMVWNFALNRRFSFSYARSGSILHQFLGYIAACSVGAVANYFTTIALWKVLPVKTLAAIAGVLVGVAFNFVAARFVIFRAKHIKRAPQE